MNPNETAICAVIADNSLALAEYRPGQFRALPEELFLSRPAYTHSQLVALLDGIVESEWENWIIDCFKSEHGKRHQIRGLVAQHGGVYAE
jgi:hypothetical protein